MEGDDGTKKNLNRRGFLKTTALGVGATALVGLGSKEVRAMPPPDKWDKETDVVVIGFGGAGAAAAIEAHDAGAKVLLLEKQPGWGGNTGVSAGAFMSPKVPLNLDIVEYLIACGKGRVDRETASAWAKEAVTLPDWFQKHLGAKLSSLTGLGPYHPYKGGEQVSYWLHAGRGAGLFKVLSDAVKTRNIEVMLETPTKELVANKEGEVLGILAEKEGNKLYIKAKRGVILACGGFDFNDWYKLQNLRVSPTYGTGCPGNTGDAITMAGKLGAKLWKMNELNGNLCYKFPESEIAWPTGLQLNPVFIQAPASVVIVNKYGKRFTNETLAYDSFYMALCFYDIIHDEYPNVPCYTIFDETARLSAPLGFGRGWSADNSKEIAKGWIIKSDTIKELAKKTGLDPAALEGSVTQYNSYAEKKADPDFGRRLLKPLKTPPYYSIIGYPGSFGTMGGPKINSKAQVVDTYEKVIPRLYAAGNASSGAWGFHYNGGGGNADAFAFGRISGEMLLLRSLWNRVFELD